MHVIDVSRLLIIVNKHGCPPSPGYPVYAFHYKQGHRNILSKTPVFRLVFSIYMWGQPDEKKGRYLLIYSVLDLSRRICVLFSKPLVSQPHRILWKLCCTKRTVGKTTELGTGPLAHDSLMISTYLKMSQFVKLVNVLFRYMVEQPKKK